MRIESKGSTGGTCPPQPRLNFAKRQYSRLRCPSVWLVPLLTNEFIYSLFMMQVVPNRERSICCGFETCGETTLYFFDWHHHNHHVSVAVAVIHKHDEESFSGAFPRLLFHPFVNTKSNRRENHHADLVFSLLVVLCYYLPSPSETK